MVMSMADNDITAYHGTPHDFDQFDMSKIGTGQGEQAYGHGLYFASNEDLAKSYRDDLSSQKQLLDNRPVDEISREALMSDEINPDQEVARFVNQYGRTARNVMALRAPHLLDHYDMLTNEQRLKPAGKMYEVRIKARPEHIMDWDRPISEQPHIMGALQAAHASLDPEHPKFEYLDNAHKNIMGDESKGAHAHYYLRSVLGNKGATDYLSGMGIKGIKYLDYSSRAGGVGEGSSNYVIFDDSLVNVAKKYADGGSIDEYADGGPVIENAVSVFPKPQRMFPDDAPVPGGMYLNAKTKEDMTGHKAAVASIGVEPGGKPYFHASPDEVDQTGTPGRGSAIAKTNLFKQRAGWRWAQAPEGHENTSTIVSVEHRGKHTYALNAHFPKGVDLARYENAPSEPRLRPTTRGNVELGPQVGSILVRGKEHPVHEHVIVRHDGGRVDPPVKSRAIVDRALSVLSRKS